jgi:diguanylate cyclase (GGDEF)-like protein/PAS domain S-box-containing protein
VAAKLRSFAPAARPQRPAFDDSALDRIAEVSARALGVAIAAISFVDGREIVVRGVFGLAREALVSQADVALIASVIANGSVYVVPDARRDKTFESALALRGARSYAGVPIFARDGRVLGVLGAFDRSPRTFSGDEIATLRACAALVAELERFDVPSGPTDATSGRLVHAERRLALLESVVLSSTVSMAITAAGPANDPEIIYVNESFSRTFGFAPHEILGRGASITRAEDMDPAIKDRVTAAREAREAITIQYPARRKDGSRFWCETTVSPVMGDAGTCEGFVSISSDITSRLSAERFLHDRGLVLESIANDAPVAHVYDAIVASAERSATGVSASIMLRRGDYLYIKACGPAFRAALEGRMPVVVVGDPDDPCATAVARGEQIVTAPEQSFGGAYGEMVRKLGFTRCISTPIRRSDGDVVGALGLHMIGDRAPTDGDLRVGNELAHLVGIAAERRSDRDRLEFLAHHDTMTGLPNRLSFEALVSSAISLAAGRGRRIAIGTLDLVRFKIVNDGLGHAAGDRLLREIAMRLGGAARPGDRLARLGGDEFAILMDDLDERGDAAAIARDLLAALAPSFRVNDQEVFIRACIGIASYPEDGDDAAALLAACENALGDAYARDVDVAFCDATATLGRRGGAQIALETSLRHALARDELYVLFQPLIDLRRREMRGAEALLRWRDPVLGEVLPDAFIRAAEETGLIVPIGAWVLDEACRFARRWQDVGLDRFVSVNVSARQFDRPDFVSTVTNALVRNGLEPSRLHLEVTESLVMRSPEDAVATLGDLKALGVKISIDDFGTGYSSFTYLKRFPLDALKIDRHFVRDIGLGNDARNDEAIVRAIVGVARALDLDVVAEGVETEDQAAFLRAIGVPFAQGFLFAPALRPSDAFEWRERTR